MLWQKSRVQHKIPVKLYVAHCRAGVFCRNDPVKSFEIVVGSCLGAMALSMGGTVAAADLSASGALDQRQRGNQRKVFREPLAVKARPGVSEAQAKTGDIPTQIAFDHAVRVAGFEFSGVTMLGEPTVQAIVAPFVGKALRWRDLQAVVTELRLAYHRRGYLLADAYLPEQDFGAAGSVVTVRLSVLEGRLGAIRYTPVAGSLRLDPSWVRDALPQSSTVLSQTAIDDVLARLNAIPGVVAQVSTSDGAAKGTSDLGVSVTEAGVFQGDLTASFEEYSAISSRLALNDQLGRGDQLLAQLLFSQGQQWMQLQASSLFASPSLRVGARHARLVQQAGGVGVNAALAGRADATGASVDWVVNAQATVGAAVERKTHVLGGGVLGQDRRLAVGSLVGTWQDAVGPFSLLAHVHARGGRVTLHAPLDAARDSAGANIAGNFVAVRYAAQAQLRVGRASDLRLSVSGQHASKNLDASEAFSGGGLLGVRAYRAADVVGDEGAVLNLELGRQYGPNLRAHLFVEGSQIHVNRDPWPQWRASNPASANNFGVAGAGFGINYAGLDGWVMSTVVACSLGSRPPGLPASTRTRAWASVTRKLG